MIFSPSKLEPFRETRNILRPVMVKKREQAISMFSCIVDTRRVYSNIMSAARVYFLDITIRGHRNEHDLLCDSHLITIFPRALSPSSFCSSDLAFSSSFALAELDWKGWGGGGG